MGMLILNDCFMCTKYSVEWKEKKCRIFTFSYRQTLPETGLDCEVLLGSWGFWKRLSQKGEA